MNGLTTVMRQNSRGTSRALVTFTFLLGIFMGALDHSIVGPALSSIFETFNIVPAWGVWSFTAYTLVFAVSIPIFGKLSDRFGRKQTFVFGIISFAFGSLIAAFATNFVIFLLGRAIQAIGAGGIFPITAAHIAISYPPEQRGKALGWIGVSFGIGSIMGPTVGSIIVSNMNWQWIFLINVPISLLILLMIARFNPNQPVVKKPIDFLGIIMMSAIIVALMLGITLINIWIISAGIMLIPLLMAVEKRQADPLINIKYFSKANTVTLLLSSAVSGFIMATAANFIPLFSEIILGLEKGSSGFTVTPLAIASVVASLIGGFMTDKYGAKRAFLTGLLLTMAAGTTLAIGVNTVVELSAVSVVMGFGIGIIGGSPLNVMILQVVDPKETGLAVGYISLFRSLGSTLGPTFAGQMLVSFNNGFVPMFYTSALVSALSILLVIRFVRKKSR